MVETVITHNSISDMIIVLNAFAAGYEIEFICIVEDKKAGHFLFDEWSTLRTDLPAFELFNFQNCFYRMSDFGSYF